VTLPVAEPVRGLVLAGGRSRRFTHGAKALEPLGDEPMIAHVLRRLLPQVEGAWISTGAGSLALDALPDDLRQLTGLPDPAPRFRGPLAGLAAGLEALADSGDGENGAPAWLQLAPCDAPFLPRDLVERLLSASRQEDADERGVIVPRAEGHLQPTFAAWHVSTLEFVQSALASRGGAGLLDVLRQLPHRVVDWPVTSPPAFFNVNTREELQQATDWLQSATRSASR
jgi:molybdopterin-guanine dinucleotide biosynthesis protein A